MGRRCCGVWKPGILGLKRRACQIESAAKAISDQANGNMEFDVEEVGFMFKGIIPTTSL